MEEVTRRAMLGSVVIMGASATVAAAPVAGGASTAEDEYDWTESEKIDRQRVIDCGFTEDEADCWELVVRAGAKFFSLPQLHPATQGEVAQAIHVLQDKLLGRPAYRKHLELANGSKK